MRICSPHCGISPTSNLGGEVYESIILKELAAQGAELEVILPKNKPYEKEVGGLHVTELSISKGLRWYIAPLVFPAKINQVYKSRPFDLLRVHSVRFIGPASLLSRRLYRLPVPVVTHYHHLDIDTYSKAIDKRVLERSDIVITDSKFSRRQLKSELGLDVSHVRVIPGGIDEKYQPDKNSDEWRAKLGFKDSITILLIANLTKRKNPQFLLNCFAKLISANGNDIKLVIGGKGELLPVLKEQARNLGISDKVIFLGFVPEEDKVKLYNSVDILAFPSLMEGFGLVVGEAMACGKPVVISDRGSLPELVEDGVQGFVGSATDEADFTAKLRLLTGNRELRLKLGQAGRIKVEREYRWNNTVKQILEVYEDAVKKNLVKDAS